MELNRDKMIALCESMIALNSKSNSVFAGMNLQIWQAKLKWWKTK